MVFKADLEGDLEVDLEWDSKEDSIGDFRGDFKQGLQRGLAFVSSSGQFRSMSGLVDLGIQVYCCEISDLEGT